MRVEFISDRMSYITVKSHLCDNITLNVHALRIKVMIQGHVFNHFPKFHVETL